MLQTVLHFPHKSEHLAQFARYVAVGTLMLLLNLIMVWGLAQFWHLHYLVACSIAFVLESVLAFFANRRWTFRTSTRFRHGYMKFLTIAFYSFLVILIVTYGLVHYLAFHYIWARTVSTVITGFIGYFFDMRITFRV